MGIKIKHTDPTLNSFSTDDLVVNVSEGSLFFKSNTELFRIKGDTLTTTVTESFGDELWHRTGNNLYYTSGSVGIGTATPSDNPRFLNSCRGWAGKNCGLSEAQKAEVARIAAIAKAKARVYKNQF